MRVFVLVALLMALAAINIVALDEDRTITPNILKAGLLSLPVFRSDLRVVNQDSSLYLKVARCILKILAKKIEPKVYEYGFLKE